MSVDNELPEESGLTEKQIANMVNYLNAAFASACNAYRSSKRNSGKKAVNYVAREPRSYKPILSDDFDYTLYYAQIEFAYLIDEIQRGPVALASIEVKKCNDLINSLAV